MFACTPWRLVLLWALLLLATHIRVRGQDVLSPETIARVTALTADIRPDIQRFLDRREGRGLLYLYTFQEGQRHRGTDATADMSGKNIMGNMYIAPQRVAWGIDHPGCRTIYIDGHKGFTMYDSKLLAQQIFESREFTMEFILSIERTGVGKVHPVAAFTHNMRPHLNFEVNEHGDPWDLMVLGQSTDLPIEFTVHANNGFVVLTRKQWNSGGPEVIFTMVATDTTTNGRVLLGHRLRMNYNEDTYVAIRFRDGTRPVMSISPQNGSNIVTHATFGDVFNDNLARVFRFDREFWDRRAAPLKMGAQGRRHILLPFMGTVSLLSMYNIYLSDAAIARNARFHPPALPFSNLVEFRADEYQRVTLHPEVSDTFQHLVFNETFSDIELD
jgi:hypothetical protein